MNKVLIITSIVLAILFFRNIFDHGMYNFSSIEIGNNFSRREYLGNELGRIYKNRFGLYYFDVVYPVCIKMRSIFLSDLGNYPVYITLIVLLTYAGIRKYHEN